MSDNSGINPFSENVLVWLRAGWSIVTTHTAGSPEQYTVTMAKYTAPGTVVLSAHSATDGTYGGAQVLLANKLTLPPAALP